jgi:murein DD-endopeptidase MepM/ murein hydrolase activator NlpD
MVAFFAILIVLALVAMQLPQPALARTGCKAIHTVRAGETLAAIADRYKVSVKDIVDVNHLASPYTIYVGQSLCIPQGSAPGNKPPYSQMVAANFYPAVRGNELNIRTENFPKNSSYYVKVTDPRKGLPIKIGMLKIKDNGAVSRNFPLPEFFRRTTRINVCLKNAVNDVNVCRLVFY